MKIAIQGVHGSFHHLASMRYFGNDITILPKATFRDVFESLKNNEADTACVAIENSIYGSLYENYDLLKDYHFPIVGEIFLKITHNLMALPGETLESITTIMSHPVALKQCQNFLTSLKERGVIIQEHEDTAKAAQEISEQKLPHTAAIASAAAHELFELPIIAPNIQDHENNYTRFLFLQKNPSPFAHNKASIHFTIPNTPGSLVAILQTIAEGGGNMTKIESRPIIGSVWEYQFYCDIEANILMLESILTAVKSKTKEYHLLGTYTKGIFSN